MSDRKLKMSAIFLFEIKGTKKDKILNFAKDCFTIMGDPMDVIFGVFSEISMKLLKSIISQFFSKYSKSYGNLNVKSCLKLNVHKQKHGPRWGRQIVCV